jgi:hypothetical protein
MIERILVGLGGTEYSVSEINHAVAIAIRLTSVGAVLLTAAHCAYELANERM